jgi:hypothetical protein
MYGMKLTRRPLYPKNPPPSGAVIVLPQGVVTPVTGAVNEPPYTAPDAHVVTPGIVTAVVGVVQGAKGNIVGYVVQVVGHVEVVGQVVHVVGHVVGHVSENSIVVVQQPGNTYVPA